MKPRILSGLLLLATLAIGIILGALLHSSLSSQRLNRAQMLRTEANFIEALESAIAPTSEAQAAQINAVLVEAAPLIIDQVRQNREQLRAQLDSIRARLQPVLDENQLQELDSRLYASPRRRQGQGK